MRIAACMLTLAIAFTPTVRAAPATLYEWLAIAPVVAVGENLGTYGKYAEFQIQETLRGASESPSLIRVNVRRANRDRNRKIEKAALRFDAGLSYVLLLTPVATRKADALPTYEFARGARGAREVPLEGAVAYLDAVRRFIRIQDRNDDRLTWREMKAMLEETHPVLIRTALDQYLKFRRGDVPLIGSLRPLLDHPEATTREGAVSLIGQIVEQESATAIPDAVPLRSELLSKARRDPVVAVRVAATRAFALLAGEQGVEILEEIARDDSDQEVRYAAERWLYERNLAVDGESPEERTGSEDGAAPRAGNGSD